MVKHLVKTAADVTSSLGLWISAALLVYIVVHIMIEVVLRNFFGSSTNSMGEYVGYAMGAMTYLAIAHTFASRRHVRVSLLRGFTARRQRLAVAVELFCIGATFVAFSFATWHIWKVLARDFSRGSVSATLTETPTWYIDAAVFTGLAIFLLQLVSSALEVLEKGVPEDIEGD